jgi:parallel beta-helix repeat protein
MRHSVIPTIITIALGVTAGSTVAGVAHASAPVACGTVVTDDLRLRNDVTGCTGPGLVVGAPGVRIDLGGHTVSGTGTSPGIDNGSGFDDVTVRNGTVRGFAWGVDAVEADGSRFERLRFVGNGQGMIVSRSVGVDIDRVTIEDSSFDGLSLTFDEGTTIRRSTVRGSGWHGVMELASIGSQYDRNTFVDNALDGIELMQSDGVVLTANEASANGEHGIELSFWARTSELSANRTSGNAGNGLQIDEPGNTVAHHRAVANTGIGIVVADDTIDAGRNRASDNGAGDCVNITCS